MIKINIKMLLDAAQNASRLADDLISIYNMVNDNPDILKEYQSNELKDLQISLRDMKDTSSFLGKKISEDINNRNFKN